MPNLALDLSGPIQGITAYADDGKDPCARDCTVTLPEVSPLTNDLKAGGTLSVPDMSQIDSMETTVSKMGVDANFGALAAAKKLEIRFAQQVVQQDGTQKTVGGKAYLRVMLKKLPGVQLETGAANENEYTYETSRYQLFVDGKEILLIDKLLGIVRIGGKNFTDSVLSVL